MVSADMDAYDLIFMDGLMPVMVRCVLFRSMSLTLVLKLLAIYYVN